MGDSIGYGKFNTTVTVALRDAGTFHDVVTTSTSPGIAASDVTDCARNAQRHRVVNDDAVSMHGDSILIGDIGYFRGSADSAWQKDKAPAWAATYLCSAAQVLDMRRQLADGSFTKSSAQLTFDVTSTDHTGTTFKVGHRDGRDDESTTGPWTVKLDPRGRPAKVVTPTSSDGATSTVTFSHYGQAVSITAPASATSSP